MATTTNFGWTTPDDTDLVKDGAAAIRTLGSAIDTSLVDLKGGTTGQVLAKASGTDMDFTWSSVDPLTILDAKGDLISATAADTPARLAVGTDGQILTADSSTSTGLKWETPATAGFSGCRITRSGTLNIANNTYTAVSFNLEDFDTDSYHDTSTNNSRITIPSGKGGYFLLVGNMMWGTDNTGQRELVFYKNGAVINGNAKLQATSSGGPALCLSIILDLAVGDYVEMYVWQNSGQQIGTNAANTVFQAQFLGA